MRVEVAASSASVSDDILFGLNMAALLPISGICRPGSPAALAAVGAGRRERARPLRTSNEGRTDRSSERGRFPLLFGMPSRPSRQSSPSAGATLDKLPASAKSRVRRAQYGKTGDDLDQLSGDPAPAAETGNEPYARARSLNLPPATARCEGWRPLNS